VVGPPPAQTPIEAEVVDLLLPASGDFDAAKKDGEEDRAVQKRLGIRRTRLGR